MDAATLYNEDSGVVLHGDIQQRPRCLRCKGRWDSRDGRGCARCAMEPHAEQSLEAALLEQGRPQDPMVLGLGRTTGQ
jgi:hypothetical protein